jgi:hypothetical protein
MHTFRTHVRQALRRRSVRQINRRGRWGSAAVANAESHEIPVKGRLAVPTGKYFNINILK